MSTKSHDRWPQMKSKWKNKSADATARRKFWSLELSSSFILIVLAMSNLLYLSFDSHSCIGVSITQLYPSSYSPWYLLALLHYKKPFYFCSSRVHAMAMQMATQSFLCAGHISFGLMIDSWIYLCSCMLLTLNLLQRKEVCGQWKNIWVSPSSTLHPNGHDASSKTSLLPIFLWCSAGYEVPAMRKFCISLGQGVPNFFDYLRALGDTTKIQSIIAILNWKAFVGTKPHESFVRIIIKGHPVQSF
jgi:hypothetical protein